MRRPRGCAGWLWWPVSRWRPSVFGASDSGKGFWRFVLDSRAELRKVVWPARRRLIVTTAVVFAFVIVAGVFFWLLDLFLSWATRLLTGQGG